MVIRMFKLNLILNVIIVIGLFIIDGFTSNVLGLFGLILILLLPKIRGLLFNKKIKTNMIYEICELLLNIYLLIIIFRSLFDNTISQNNFVVYSYPYIVVRIVVLILILIIFNLLLWKSDNLKKIDIDDYNFSYVILFISIFNIYFALKYQQHFNSLVSVILCSLNIYFCYKLIDDLNYKQSGLFYSIMISILGILNGNEILLIVCIRSFIMTYNKYKINYIKGK